jgi:hypothetical protein
MRMRFRTAFTAAALAGSLFVSVATAALAVTLDSGSQIQCNLQQQLDSKTAKDGDTFTCTTANLTDASGQPVHGTVYGHLSEVVASSYTHKAHMKLNFDRLVLADGTSAPVNAQLVSVDKKQNTNFLRAASIVVGSMVAGNVVGKWVGTNIGGMLGFGTGVLYAANVASDIVVPQYANVKISLTSTLTTRQQATN